MERKRAMSFVPYEQERPLIIIVEDDPGNAHLLETILQGEASCWTCAYQSGESVLEHLEEIAQRHVTLVLVDYTLPGINGLSLCQRLHTLEKMQHIPLVLVTGRDEAIQEAKQQGIRVLAKPFDLDQLLEIVERETTPSEQCL